ncbi:pilus assembly protein TadG-related protein [Taklimakanibacter lacteus]|uniref:pilus assembly protein TadG-related protein n=1 Tax=Taklimakanibacter lacteus TaxID=2268456 RepID=UPI0013C459F2
MHTETFKTWLKARSALNHFFAGDKASVAPIFAISAIPIVMITGIAVDSSRLSSARVHVQAATDAAALSAAAAYGTGNDSWKDIANAVFDSNLAQSDELTDANLETDVSVNTVDNTLTMTAKGSIPTTLTSIGGFEEMSIGNNEDGTISSTVTLPIFSDYHKGQIVLVMDYSSSMYETVGGTQKYMSMRDEASKLVKYLSQNLTNTDVEFGLVPFSHAVRVTMPKNYYYGQTGTTTTTSCVDDRNYPYNLSSETPNTGTTYNSTKFFKASCSYFSTNKLNVRPLSTDHAATNTQITEMIPYGNTHISLGMETAWHLLTPNLPYAATENTEETLKAVVLLTDGKQTSPGNGPNNALSVAQAEANLEVQCQKMKDAGIRVITVSFDLADADTEKRLKDCASVNLDNVAAGEDPPDPPDKYFFDVDTNEELVTAFGIIRDSLARTMFVSK